ncbi:aldehyde ferredoxin oxidoreductase family protein [candidate division KSB1 bacterium]|nr:aldehyde ferredoxin oxidoreductase family protein [candidate division KSB1 bacterium]
METITGSTNRILEIDLTSKRVTEFIISAEDRRLYLGGKGLGLKYLYERMRPGIDPLAEENYMAFMMGMFLGTGAPCSSRFAAVTKSPLTGIFASSSCGGPFGMALKTAGYEGLLITGKSEQPVCLEIAADGVHFIDATQLWGKDTAETQAAFKLGNDDGALAIGPAGENLVLYANIASGHRFLGRGGFGAVMGAKRLKAIVARGGRIKYLPEKPEAFKKNRKKALKEINSNIYTAELYRNYGTTANVRLCSQGNILPVMNFKNDADGNAEAVTGESMRAKYQTRTRSCRACAIACGHKGTLADGTEVQIPEYETTALFGPNLGVFDPDEISRWNAQCGKLGLDTISVSVSLAYLMEAAERGLINNHLKFGNPNGISEMLEDIAYRRGLGDDLANGTRWLSEKYGGKEFAMHVKGLELAAYDPRGSWGQGLSYAVANRGACHLSATTFALEVFLKFLNPFTTRAKAKFVRFFENLYSGINSLQTCQFTSYAYVLEALIVKYTPKFLIGFAMQYLPDIALKTIDVRKYSKLFESISGIKLSQKDFLKVGERVHILERFMNTQEGISRKDDTLPARFLNDNGEHDSKLRSVPLEKMLPQYYKLRGYDDDGVPKPETLKKLGIPI